MITELVRSTVPPHGSVTIQMMNQKATPDHLVIPMDGVVKLCKGSGQAFRAGLISWPKVAVRARQRSK